MRLRFVLAAIFLLAPLPMLSQVVPSATEGGLPFAVGGGFSDYNIDWGPGRMQGGTVWIDWNPNQAPSFLHGFGLEVEARDISLGGTKNQPPNYRLDAGGGGVVYSWQRFHRFHPYAKFLLAYGGFDWNNPNPHFKHETRTVYAPGGGFDYHFFRHIWVRADYEYQIWPDVRSTRTHERYLDPQGVTVGVLYNFKNVRGR